MKYSTRHTGTQIGRTTAAERGAPRVLRREPEVGYVDLTPVCVAKDVFRLQVTVEHPSLVARVHRIQDLQERKADQLVVAVVRLALEEDLVQVGLAVLRDEVKVMLVFEGVVQREDVGDVRDERVKVDLPPLILDFRRIDLANDLHRPSNGSRI